MMRRVALTPLPPSPSALGEGGADACGWDPFVTENLLFA